MADAGFTHAAGADIPQSATSRRGMLPALAGLAVGLAYATVSVYWAVGGRCLLNTVGISPSQPGQAGHLAALLAVWGAAAVKAVATVLPLLAIGVWPRTANGGLRRLARVLTWIEAAILTGYGLVPTASGLLVQAGVIKAAAHADRLAREWHAYLWDPWFLIWGIFVFLALWRSRSASQDHLPGAPGAAAARSYGYPGAAAGRGGGGGCPWPGGGGHRPGGGQCDAGEHVPPAADRHHAMAGSLTGRAQRGQRAGDNDGELRALAAPVAAALLAAGPTWLAVGVASGFLAAAALLLWPVRLYQQHPDPGHARGSLLAGRGRIGCLERLSPLRTGRSVHAVSSDTRRRETRIFGVIRVIEDQITTLRPYNARYTGDPRSIFRKAKWR
jgi:Protein of unknown function (DUF3995)